MHIRWYLTEKNFSIQIKFSNRIELYSFDRIDRWNPLHINIDNLEVWKGRFHYLHIDLNDMYFSMIKNLKKINRYDNQKINRTTKNILTLTRFGKVTIRAKTNMRDQGIIDWEASSRWTWIVMTDADSFH